MAFAAVAVHTLYDSIIGELSTVDGVGVLASVIAVNNRPFNVRKCFIRIFHGGNPQSCLHVVRHGEP